MQIPFCALTALLCCLTIPTLGQPDRFNYQAKLTDSGGIPLSGSHAFFFSVYQGGSAGAANSGTLVFKESVSKQVADGIVSHAVGTGSNITGGSPGPAVFQTTSDVFLQVAVDLDSNVVLPRTEIESVPYALVSADGERRTPINTAGITISADGSYYLTSNLSASNNQNGVLVQAKNVTLDLNGFSIVGTGTGSGAGIVIVSGAKNVRIRNGTIRDFGSAGINGGATQGVTLEELAALNNGSSGASIGTSSTVSHCQFRGNRNNGLDVSDGSAIKDCVAVGNAAMGFTIDTASLIENSISDQNSTTGIFMSGQCHVLNCTVRNNGGNGIQSNEKALIESCVVGKNGDNGITIQQGSHVVHCVSFENKTNGILVNIGHSVLIEDCTATSNSQDGIATQNSGLVVNCTANANGADGIDLRGKGSVARGCMTSENGQDGIHTNADCVIENCSSYVNIDNQIECGNSCDVHGNRCDGSTASNSSGSRGTGDGINVGTGSVVTDNVCVDSNTGIATGNNSLVIHNIVKNNATDFATGTSTVGPTVNSGNIATSTNPHSNYSH